jgi:hypothetical protein
MEQALTARVVVVVLLVEVVGAAVVVAMVGLHLLTFPRQLAARMAAQVVLALGKQIISVVGITPLFIITALALVVLTVSSGLVALVEPHRSHQLA